MKYSVAIFDMDGTILDTLKDLTNAMNYALKENGYPERTIDEIRAFLGNGISGMLKNVLPEGTVFEESEKVRKSFQAYYTEHCSIYTKPYDGIPELVSSLRANGVKTAVVSNKLDSAVNRLSKQYFDELFDISIGEKESEGIKQKPAPDMVNIILSVLNVEKNDCVFIGDSEVDIETAKNSGIDCICVNWGFRTESFLKEHGAPVIVETPEELKSKIL